MVGTRCLVVWADRIARPLQEQARGDAKAGADQVDTGRVEIRHEEPEAVALRTFNPIRRHRERCREARAQMSDYLDGELDPRAAAGVKRHVRWCPNRRRMLDTARSSPSWSMASPWHFHTLRSPPPRPAC